ncbi:MAG: phage tail tape measure protein, partial [Clostridia bacterium]|nr:phage tail tape measure protein [Clostridia bacterium]
MAQPDGSLVFDTKIITDGFKKGTLALGASVTALAGTVVKLGADFEATAAKASTLFGQVAVDTANLNKKILEISSSTGLAATELNEALYSALSAGIPVTEDMAKATGFLESAAKLAKAGFTDTDTAISATAKTLNAYKLDVSEAERIQGILIQTQNKGITTVNELGASLAQVTPTAAAFSVSFENVGAALATMTAQGTPTAQATTQLNQLIAELGKNGTAAAKNLKAAAQGTSFAGKSFKDMMESGASLSDILMLIQKQAEKNGVSMVDMFSSIEAGKSALAIVSGNAQTFNSNLEAMNDTAGLVEEGYEKMMNTLEGQTDKFIQSAKNLGIGFYEGIKEPLTEAVKAGNDSLSELQEAVANGELKSALTNAGTLIGKFVSVLIKLATSVIPPLVNALGFLGDNIGLCAAAFVILKTSAAITGVITTVTTGIKTMTAGVQGATVAQKLWNAAMSANPIGAVVTGVVALTAGIVALVAAFDNAPEWEKECEEIRSHREELEQTNKEWQEVVKAQKNAEASANSEMNHIQKLSQELRGLADENGNVAESERARAQFILGELNEALGTEYSMNQGRISQYQQLSAEIDNLIAKKRAEALLSSKQEAYDSAVGQIGEKRAILQEETRQYQLAREEVERYTNQIEYLKQKQKELEETKPPDWEYEYDSLTLKIDGLNDELEGANAKLGEHKGAMDAASIAVNDLNTTISDYEGTYENIIKGDYDAVFKGSYKSASGYADGTSAALADGQSDVEATASSIGQDVANAVGDGLKIAVPNTESAMKEFGNQLNKTMSPVIEGARAEGENLILSLAGGVSLKITDAVTVSEDGSQKIIDGLKVSEAVAKQLGIDYIQGVMNGMDSMINPLWNKAFTIMQGMHEYGAKPGVRSNSPAKDGIDLGTDYVLGVEIGLEDEAPELNKTAKETAQDMNKSFADTLSHGMNTIRSEIAS